MSVKKVKQLLHGQLVDMGGVPVRQPLPTQKIESIDPFLLIHHHATQVPTDRHITELGVGPHPHRGFSPVTFIFNGSLHHRDSRGNSSIVRAGGAQWLEAGMGIIHSERPAKEMTEAGGLLEIIQIWINTPHKHKMDQPRYQPLQPEDVPSVSDADTKTTYQLFAGKQEMIEGPAKTQTSVLAITATIEKGGKHAFEIPKGYQSMVYLLDGKLKFTGFGLVEGFYLAYMEEEEGSTIEMEALEDTRILLLAGEPLREPVMSHGPFVMSNQTEIMTAMRDYQMGKMGFLVEEF